MCIQGRVAYSEVSWGGGGIYFSVYSNQFQKYTLPNPGILDLLCVSLFSHSSPLSHFLYFYLISQFTTPGFAFRKGTKLLPSPPLPPTGHHHSPVPLVTSLQGHLYIYSLIPLCTLLIWIKVSLIPPMPICSLLGDGKLRYKYS